MKKTVILFSLIITTVACNTTDSDNTTTTPVTKEDPEVVKGLDLVAKSDCFSCHKVADKLSGPAYTAVAAKYPANEESINYLAQKIQKGGSGVWGTIPMLQHPDISTEDAKLMAKYILSLR